jgi:uncharacterized protein YkwD
MLMLARNRLLAVAAGAAALLALGAGAAAKGKACANADTSAAQLPVGQARAALVCLMNKQRAANGLPPFKESKKLDGVAQSWTDTIVAMNNLTHGNVGARLTSAGIHWKFEGENIATGVATAREALHLYVITAGHCQNVFSPTLTRVGVGVNKHPVRSAAPAGSTWTADFVLPSGKNPPSHNFARANRCPK